MEEHIQIISSYLYQVHIRHFKPLSAKVRYRALHALVSRLSISQDNLTSPQPLNPFQIQHLSWV